MLTYYITTLYYASWTSQITSISTIFTSCAVDFFGDYQLKFSPAFRPWVFKAGPAQRASCWMERWTPETWNSVKNWLCLWSIYGHFMVIYGCWWSSYGHFMVVDGPSHHVISASGIWDQLWRVRGWLCCSECSRPPNLGYDQPLVVNDHVSQLQILALDDIDAMFWLIKNMVSCKVSSSTNKYGKYGWSHGSIPSTQVSSEESGTVCRIQEWSMTITKRWVHRMSVASAQQWY